MAAVLGARGVAKEGQQDAVRDALREVARASREEEGNLAYQPFQDSEEPRVFQIFEMYRDDAALKAHGESAHFAEWVLERAVPLLEARERHVYTALDA